MRVAVTEFKAKCTKLFRAVEQDNETIEITRRGKVIAVPQMYQSLLRQIR